MPICSIGIVGHVARTRQIQKLMLDTGAAIACIDNGEFGCHGNHRRTWRHLVQRHSAEWFVVLEDDAVPCEGFRDQLAKMLEAAPGPVVSLYLGKVRPPQAQWAIGPATQRADERGACFIVTRSMEQLLHAVGLAIRADLVPDMLASLDDELPIDEAIGLWAHKRRYRVSYTWPSIVDHADGETLLQHRDGQKRETGRVAWRSGVRDHWENTIVEMM